MEYMLVNTMIFHIKLDFFVAFAVVRTINLTCICCRSETEHLLFDVLPESPWYVLSSAWLYSQSPAALRCYWCPSGEIFPLLLSPFAFVADTWQLKHVLHHCWSFLFIFEATATSEKWFKTYLVSILSAVYTELPEIAAFEVWLLSLQRIFFWFITFLFINIEYILRNSSIYFWKIMYLLSCQELELFVAAWCRYESGIFI